MFEFLQRIEVRWHKNKRATLDQLDRVERTLGRRLPGDYRAFLLWSNGGEGQLRETYLSLWPLEELPQLNKDYQVDHYLPNILAIGSDGGSRCVALDYRASADHPSLVIVPFGDLDATSITLLGRSFREGVENLMQAAGG